MNWEIFADSAAALSLQGSALAEVFDTSRIDRRNKGCDVEEELDRGKKAAAGVPAAEAS